MHELLLWNGSGNRSVHLHVIKHNLKKIRHFFSLTIYLYFFYFIAKTTTADIVSSNISPMLSILTSGSLLVVLLLEYIYLVKIKDREFNDVSLYRLFTYSPTIEADLTYWVASVLSLSFIQRLTQSALVMLMKYNWKGLLLFLNLNNVVMMILSFLVISFFDYSFHLIIHRVPCLWELHKVHHATSEMTVLSIDKEHPIIVVLNIISRMIILTFLGVSLHTIFLIMILKRLQGEIQHSKCDSNWGALGYLFISPKAHHIHHSINPRDQHSNFGFDITLWDRILKTYRPPVKNEPVIIIGLKGTDAQNASLHIFVQLFVTMRKSFYALSHKVSSRH